MSYACVRHERYSSIFSIHFFASSMHRTLPTLFFAQKNLHRSLDRVRNPVSRYRFALASRISIQRVYSIGDTTPIHFALSLFLPISTCQGSGSVAAFTLPPPPSSDLFLSHSSISACSTKFPCRPILSFNGKCSIATGPAAKFIASKITMSFLITSNLFTSTINHPSASLRLPWE